MLNLTSRALLIAVSFWLTLMLMMTPGFAQNTTRGQRDLATEIQADRDRRDQAARAQQGQDAARNNYDSQKAREAFEAQDRAEAPARAAAADAERARRAQASAAQDALLAQIRASRMAVHERFIAKTAYEDVGLLLLRARDYSGAFRAFQLVDTVAPGDVAAQYGRARAKSGLGDNAGALADINTLLTRSPNSSSATRAEILAAKGDYKEAMQEFNEVLLSDPKDSYALIGRGKLKIAQGDQDGGLVDLRLAVNLYKNDEPAKEALEVALSKIEGRALSADVAARVAPVVTLCDRLAAAGYDYSRPYTMSWADKIDNPTAAVSACRLEVSRSPNSTRTKFQLARALIYAMQCDEAVTLLKSAGQEGSAAALYLYGDLDNTGCKKLAMADPLPILERALAMGNARAAMSIGDRYNDVLQANKVNMTTDESSAMINKIVSYRKKAVEIHNEKIDYRNYGRNADSFAIYELARLASLTGTSLAGPNAMVYIHQCFALQYEPCMKFTFPQK